MNKKFLNTILFIIISVILLYFARNSFKEFNSKKVISACILAQKQTSQNFDMDIVRKECEKKIQKSINK
jgi:hypothetical protein|tara:strand:- start:159 stop:365 length:207 start_codon:yes stop_codon:yes gene_type:complete